MARRKRTRPALVYIHSGAPEVTKGVLSVRVPLVLVDALGIYAEREGKSLAGFVQGKLIEEVTRLAQEERLVYMKWFASYTGPNEDIRDLEALCVYRSLAGKIEDKPLYPRSDYESLVKQIKELIPDKRLMVPLDLCLALIQHGCKNPYTLAPGSYQFETRYVPATDKLLAEHLREITRPGVFERQVITLLWGGLPKEDALYLLDRKLQRGEITEAKYRRIREVLGLDSD